MAGIEWWQTLKEGDILFWSHTKWRYKGEVVEVRRHRHRDVVVAVDHAWTREGTHGGHGPEQDYKQYNGKRMVFTEETLMDADWNWMHRKAADIRIKLQATDEERNFRIWGEGDGISAPDGSGGGLNYQSGESPTIQ